MFLRSGNATGAVATPLCQSAAKPADSAAIEPRQQEGSETRAEETITPTSARPVQQDGDEIVRPLAKAGISSTETNTTITLATWAYSAIAIQSATARQVNRDLIETYAPKQGFALALKFDDDLAALPDDSTNSVGTLTVENTYDDVLRARQYLDDANAPLEDRVMAIAPAAEVGFLKLDYFVHRDYADKLQGPRMNAKDRAYVGSWIDTPIYKSTNVEGSNAIGHDNAMFQREAYAAVMQMEPTTHTFFDIDYLARKVAVEELYGVAIMRNDHAVWVKGA